MIGKWIDLAILVFAALGLLKGYKKGFVREVFSLVGAVLAIVVAIHGYSTVAMILTDNYSLTPGQAQLIAFAALALGITLLAVFLGYLWSKAISYTPFSVLDHLCGAAFGAAKVGVVVLVLLIVFNAMGIGFIDEVLKESVVMQRVGTLVPFVFEYLEQYWPADWARPDWLF
ncbi:MAG TPA: CvpA family protein [Firmicutes bacterium]|nr:CvpA family protein [Bacillota bacterium]